jgi:hypothetical protein
MMWVWSWIYIFNNESWKTLWTFKFAGSASWYAIGLIRVKNLKGPQNLGANLEQFTSFKELLLYLTFRYTWSPILNSWCLPFRYAYLSCRSCASFKSCCTPFTILSISWRISGQTIIMSTGLSQLIKVVHFLPYKTSKGIILVDAWYPLLYAN